MLDDLLCLQLPPGERQDHRGSGVKRAARIEPAQAPASDRP